MGNYDPIQDPPHSYFSPTDFYLFLSLKQQYKKQFHEDNDLHDEKVSKLFRSKTNDLYNYYQTVERR